MAKLYQIVPKGSIFHTRLDHHRASRRGEPFILGGINTITQAQQSNSQSAYVEYPTRSTHMVSGNYISLLNQSYNVHTYNHKHDTKSYYQT